MHSLPSTVAFRLEYVLFYQFYSKITTFFNEEKFGMTPLLQFWRKHLAETDVKMTSRRQNCHTDIMHESRLTPLM